MVVNELDNRHLAAIASACERHSALDVYMEAWDKQVRSTLLGADLYSGLILFDAADVRPELYRSSGLLSARLKAGSSFLNLTLRVESSEHGLISAKIRQF